MVGVAGDYFGSSSLLFGIMGVNLLLAIVRGVLQEVFWNPCSLRSSGRGEGQVANKGDREREEGKKKWKQRLSKRN